MNNMEFLEALSHLMDSGRIGEIVAKTYGYAHEDDMDRSYFREKYFTFIHNFFGWYLGLDPMNRQRLCDFVLSGRSK